MVYKVYTSALLALFLIGCDSNFQARTESSNSLPAQISQTKETLETLPDGDYLFVSDKLIEGMEGNHKRIHLRKTGNEVVGTNLLYLDGNPCFTGKVNQKSIVDVTLGRQIPLGNPNWQFSKGDSISLEGYTKVSEGIDIKAIEQCISVFDN